jgi:thiol-disulfide isomerase/thioredoxin
LRDAYVDLEATLKKAARHARLVSLAAELCRDFPDDGGQTYNAACFVADAARVVDKDKDLSPKEKQELAGSYGAQAVKLLGKSIVEGYRERDHMDRDADLDPLRPRKDFQALLADFDKRFPAPPLSADKQYAQLLKEYENAEKRYKSANYYAVTVADKRKAEASRPRFLDYGKRAVTLAEKHPESASALEALVWVLESTTPAAGKVLDAPTTQLRARVVGLLQKDHFEKVELGNACQRLSAVPAPDIEKLLSAAVDKHAHKAVQGLAGYALAVSLARKAAQAEKTNPSEARQLWKSAESQLEQLIANYASVPSGKSTLGEVARAKLHEVRFLSIGRVAEEIEGADLDGKKFKLSDYRGKVVVVDFWVDWCGWCRQMYPHERQLVQKFKDQPFALLGVNCDEDKTAVNQVVKKERMTWRSWWDGAPRGSRIADRWQVTAFPTIYVLDPQGVIRYKGVRGAQLEAAIVQLLAERQAQIGGKEK